MADYNKLIFHNIDTDIKTDDEKKEIEELMDGKENNEAIASNREPLDWFYKAHLHVSISCEVRDFIWPNGESCHCHEKKCLYVEMVINDKDQKQRKQVTQAIANPIGSNLWFDDPLLFKNCQVLDTLEVRLMHKTA
eukprot:221692_1